jgi:hypothetical protein
MAAHQLDGTFGKRNPHAALVLPVHDQGVHPVPGHADLRDRIDEMAGE